MKKNPFSLGELVYPIWHWWLLAWMLGIITALSVLGLLMVSGWFITLSAWAGLLMVSNFNYLAPSALIRTLAISRTVARYGDLMLSHQAIFELLKQLRVRFFYEYSQLSNHQRAFLGSSVVQHRLVKDIDILDEFVLRFISPWLVAGVALLAFGVLLAMKVSVWLLCLLVLPLVIALGLFLSLVKQTQSKNLLLEQRKARLLNTLPAITQLLIWQRWHEQSYRDDLAKTLWVVEQQEHHVKHIGLLVVQWAFLLTMLLTLIWGAFLVVVGSLSVAWLLALVLGFFGLVEVVMPIFAEPAAYARALHAKNQLNALLSQTAIIKDKVAPRRFDLMVKNLSVKQPNAVFGVADMSFVVKCGVPLVISGVSGGGKSTLLEALAGEILPISGTLQLCDETGELTDWQAVNWLTNGAGELGFLGQKIDIFDQSLADNLRLGKQEASDEDLWQVLEWVDLATWAKAQPQGLNTPLGEYGMAISGGQARRIALARLLLSPKKVLILDEPFAGLDKDSRLRIWQMLKLRQQAGLLIVVSHHQDIIDDAVHHVVVGTPVVV